MEKREKRRSDFRPWVVWLAVAAMVWSSGQGLALSAMFSLSGGAMPGMWHCAMLPGGGMSPDGGAGQSGPPAAMSSAHVMPASMAMAPVAPTDHSAPDGHGSDFCPICYLTGCGAPSVVTPAEFQYAPPRQRHVDAVQCPTTAPNLAAVYDRPRTRAPPILA